MEEGFNLQLYPLKPKRAPEMLHRWRHWATAPSLNSSETTGTVAALPKVLAPHPAPHMLHFSEALPHYPPHRNPKSYEPLLSLYDEHTKTHTHTYTVYTCYFPNESIFSLGSGMQSLTPSAAS